MFDLNLRHIARSCSRRPGEMAEFDLLILVTSENLGIPSYERSLVK